jgi:hypothetical protein
MRVGEESELKNAEGHVVKFRFGVFLIILLLFFGLFFVSVGVAQVDRLVLEWEQHWETYGEGGCCNFGTHNFFVGDVDGDGVLEMVTGGIMYHISEDVRTEVEAPFRIWTWDGENFTLETSKNWPGAIFSIYAADLDGDGSTEIILGARIANATGIGASLRVLSWDGEILTLRASYEGALANSVFVSDVDRDGVPEILTVRRVNDDTQSSTQLVVWQFEGGELALKKSVEWGGLDGASANSVYASDLDNDGELEIITGGYNGNVENSRGQIRVWRWDGEELSLEGSKEWCTIEEGFGVDIAGNPLGNTVVNNVKCGDVDDDGIVEIVTGGFTYDGEKVDAQLAIWNWTDKSFLMEESFEWTDADITEVKSISLDDVDGDGGEDIITSGFIGVYGGFSDNEEDFPEHAQLRVWKWNGEELVLKAGKDWVIGEGVTGWNIGTGDVDGDGVTEIVTVGCMYESSLCDPDLRVWSVAREQGQLPYALIITVTMAAFFALGILFFFARKRVKNDGRVSACCCLATVTYP